MPERPLVVATAVVVSLVLMPLAAIGWAHVVGLQGPAFQAGVLQSSMPTAVMTTILALEFDAQPQFVTSVVCIATLLSPLTVTLLIAYLQRGRLLQHTRPPTPHSLRSPQRAERRCRWPSGRRARRSLTPSTNCTVPEQRRRAAGDLAVRRHRQRRRVRHHEAVARDVAEQRDEDAGKSAEAGVGIDQQRTRPAAIATGSTTPTIRRASTRVASQRLICEAAMMPIAFTPKNRPKRSGGHVKQLDEDERRSGDVGEQARERSARRTARSPCSADRAASASRSTARRPAG